MMKLLVEALIAQALPRVLDEVGEIWNDHYGDDFLKPKKDEVDPFAVEEDPLKFLTHKPKDDL